MHGWAGYFRPAIAKNVFGMLDNFTWWRVIRMLRERHHWRWKYVGRRAIPAPRPGLLSEAMATTLATLPATSSVRGNNPLRRPVRESASSVVDAVTIIPPTENGVSAATQPGCPCNSTSRCM